VNKGAAATKKNKFVGKIFRRGLVPVLVETMPVLMETWQQGGDLYGLKFWKS